MSGFNELKRIFEEIFALPGAKFNREVLHGDVAKWDSIGHMKMVADLETTFDIEFEVDEIMEMQSVAEILGILRNHGINE